MCEYVYVCVCVYIDMSGINCMYVCMYICINGSKKLSSFSGRGIRKGFTLEIIGNLVKVKRQRTTAAERGYLVTSWSNNMLFHEM